MTRKPQQRMEAEWISTGAWQARFAYLNHSGSVSRCKDWAVVIHIRNIDVDSGSWGHCRHAAVYCLDKQGVSRHLPKHKGPTVKIMVSASFRAHTEVLWACYALLKMSCVCFKSLDQVSQPGTSWHLEPDHSLLPGDDLCIVGCLAAPLVSTH